MMKSRRWPWLTVGLVVTWTIGTGACTRREEGTPPNTGPSPATAQQESVTTTAEEGPPLEAADLAPVIQALGPTGTQPRSLVFEFARPVVGQATVNRGLGEDTRLRLRPALEGELRFTTPSTLTFVPREGFVPGTTYEVALESVETRSGVLEAPLPNPWIHRFTTPEFGFVRLSPARVDYGRQRVEVDLVFSAAVNPGQVGRHASFSLAAPGASSTPLSNVRYESGREPNVVRARLLDRALSPAARIVLTLTAGVPATQRPDRAADAASAEVRLEAGPPVDIAAAFAAEGTSGFYVEVVCDDSAVEEKRYYWDQTQGRSFGRISSRCHLGMDGGPGSPWLHLEPEVKVTTAASSGGFRIFGDFKRGSYALRIDAGVRSVDGGVLHGDFETVFSVPARKPQVHFTAKGRYLPRRSWKSLPVRHLNTDEVTLTARHVPRENLVFWMSNDDSDRADVRTSNQILSRSLALGGEPDAMTTSFIDVGSLIPSDTQGLIELRLSGHGSSDTARILLTDFHLVAKRAGAEPGKPWGREIQVWALGSSTNRPLWGVEVKLVRKSGFVLATCTTEGKKGCGLEVPVTTTDTAPPFALVASRGKDLTYLRFQDLKAEVQETRIAGDPYLGEARYRAAVYSDRGVYRPGETAHLVALVRDARNLAPREGMPVSWTLRDPRGQVFKQYTLPANGAGLVDLDVEFQAFATTGRYEAQVQVADRPIGRYPFQVEEFVPERLRVEAQSAKEDYGLGEEMEIAVRARYLFGGVPANHRVELSCELEPGSFTPEESSNYKYGVWWEGKPPRPLTLGTVTGALDSEGQGTLGCPASRGGGFLGPARLVARAAVFEAGSGRTTVGRASAPVHPESFYIGLQTSAREVEPGTEVGVQGVVVDWRGKPLADSESPLERSEVEVEFLRLETEYGWYYDEGLGHDTYRRYLRPVPLGTENVRVEDGKFQVSWRPQHHAEAYLIRARAGAARTDLKLEGKGGWYYWGPEETQVDQTPRPDKPTWIALEAPEPVRIGEEVQVRFQAPYPGRVLLTAETHRLLVSDWLEVEAGEVTWSFELESFEPNVYVTALLIKDPHLDSAQAFLPDRAFGVRSLKVEPTEFTHSLTLDVPAEVRSNSLLTVRLSVGSDADSDSGAGGKTYATVAAVDEGILSLTDFQSPDPFAAIFNRRALGVDTFETVGWSLLVPPAGPSGVTGGGEGAAALGRVQPVKPVALWSGLLEVSDEGEAEITFLVPQYRGALRVMAVTSGPKKMGRASAQVVVRDPLVLETTLPRFLTRGDRLRIPVFVTNLSGARRQVEVTLAATRRPVAGLTAAADGASPIEVLGRARKSLVLDDEAGGVAIFEARARQAVGAATVTVTARAGDLVSQTEATVPLLPAGPKVRTVERIELEEGVLDLTPHLEGWLPLSERSTFWVTANPYGDTFDHLKHLIRYPYGCLEQTTSSLRPLLYVTELLPSVDPSLVTAGKIEDMVMDGVDRLISMQTPSGGFAYWPGGTEPAYWGTAYATHVLLDAQKQRYPVPQGRVDEAVEWMEEQVTHHYEKGRQERSWYTSDAEPYIHYVLSLAGKARKGRVSRLIDDLGPAPDYERREHLYMLKAALYQAGDHRYEADLRQPDVSPIRDYRSNGWSFYSDRRMRGFMLSTYVDLFGRSPQGEPLANLVAQGLRGHRSAWYTTQELVWGITGLGKFMEAGARQTEAPVLLANGRLLAPEAGAAGTGSKDRTWSLARASEYRDLTLEVANKGEGKLYLILSSEGVREDAPPREGGEGLRVRRRYLDAAGAALDLTGGSHVLGNLVYVELTLTNTSPERIANVALVDRLPAGWEIENPRLGRGGGVEWVDPETLWEADHMDLRDDRIEVFGHLERGASRKVVYGARATASGSFTVPAVAAEAMYDPSRWARGRSQTVDIAGPWQ